MCLSIHLRSVTTESVDGSRFSAQVFVQGEECESTIRKVIAIPYMKFLLGMYLYTKPYHGRKINKS